MKLKMYLSIIPTMLSLVLSSAIDRGDIVIPLKELSASEEVTYLCPSEGGSVVLSSIDGDTNMLNSRYVNLSRQGRVSLSSSYSYELSTKSYYTFVFYGDFNSVYRNGLTNCNGYNINLTIRAAGNIACESSTNVSFYSSLQETDNYVVAQEITPDCSRFSLCLYTGSYDSGNVKITSFSYVIDSTGENGKVTGVQLYKGQIADYPGMNLDYTHNQCSLPDLGENYDGPYEDGTVYDLHMRYGTNLTVGVMKSILLAFDKSDYKYHDIVLVSDNFTANKEKLDTALDVVFSSTDDANNTSYFTFRIYIEDDVAPTIVTLDTNRTVSYTEAINEEFLLKNFTITDNYPDGIKSCVISKCDLSVKNYVGVLTFTLTVTDISNNDISIDSSIIVKDDVPPVISGEGELNLNAALKKPIDEIINSYTSEDEIDSKCEVVLESDNYSSNYSMAGDYIITISSTDTSGNKSTRDIRINVKDTNGPIFYVNKANLKVFGQRTLSVNDVFRSVVREGVIPDKNYTSVEVLEGDYFNSDNAEYGIHKVKLLGHASNSNDEIVEVNIEVVEEEKQLSATFWGSFCSFFVRLWNRIVNFFTNLF